MCNAFLQSKLNSEEDNKEKNGFQRSAIQTTTQTIHNNNKENGV